MIDVWAAGDVTAFPIKQGGLAAQQADVAARAIAVQAGLHLALDALSPRPAGGAHHRRTGPEFMRAHRAGGEGESAHSPEPLWWPPEKIAARYLGPLLAAESSGIAFEELIDLDPPDDSVTADAETEHAVALLLGAADADARGGDWRGRSPSSLWRSASISSCRRSTWPGATAGGGSSIRALRRRRRAAGWTRRWSRRGCDQRPRASDRASADAREGDGSGDAARPLASRCRHRAVACPLARDGPPAR